MTGKRKNCQNGETSYFLEKKVLKQMPTTPLSSGEKKVALGKKQKSTRDPQVKWKSSVKTKR